MLECPNCRQKFRSGARFCGSCGTSLTGTMPAVISKNSGNMELLAGSQPVSDFQAKDSLEDTLVRKKPDGFSWQSQRTILAGDEPQQATGLASAEIEEITVSITKSALRPTDSIAPAKPAMPIPPTTPALQAVHVAPGSPATASLVPTGTPVNSGLTSISAGADVAARSAKAPDGDHMPFAIPVRPGRASGNPALSDQPAEAPGNLTVLGLPGDPAEAPIDYTAFTANVNELSLNLPTLSTPAVPAISITRPLDETFISADLFAKIAASQLSATIPPAPEISAPQESARPAPLAEPTLSVLPTPPTTPASVEADEADEATVRITPSTLPTPPTTPDPTGKLLEGAIDEGIVPVSPTALVTSAGDARHEEVSVDPAAFFAPFLKPAEVPAHLLKSATPYAHLKQELAAQRMEITAAMDELLPLVYENHREENQTLFASILTNHPPLDDEAWGHAAFVLGAYGNYMYRHSLSFTKKLEIWRAQLWAVYYERSYRRKYLAQRCQQLIHFFQGCAENPTFLAIALHDLETLYFYLEPGSLRKLQQMLQTLPVPPVDLLQRVEAQMIVAEEEKAERMAKQPVPAQSKTQPSARPNKPVVQPAQSASKPAIQPVQQNANKPAIQPVQQNANKPVVQPVRQNTNRPTARPGPVRIHRPAARSAQEELDLALLPEARKWLAFLSEEQRHQFFASLRADRLEVINQLLLQGREQILVALRAELLNAGSLDYQRPRKSVPMRLESRSGPDHDRFADAFRLLNSPKLRDQQAALCMFEQNMRENTRKESEQGAREWMLYARALTQGSTRVAADWERDIRRDEASWEEIWNLAYYHHMANDLAEAARILAPGLNELDAPISHLRLALICSLTLLLKPGQAGAAVLQNARDLLIYHLERWPHPLSCLAWLALSYEVPGTLRPLDQSRRLSTFQELLEYPVNLPDPRVDLTEQQMGALGDALVSKTHCDEAWFLWLNDYAARRPHNFPAWQCLAETCERMGRLERAEMALQHIAGIYYDLDYVYAQEGEEEAQAAAELRFHVERLFDFYRRHELHRQAWDSFESCYATLNHLGFWDEQKTANRKLLTLVRPFLTQFQRQEIQRQESRRLADAQDAKARSEIRRNELSGNPTRPLEHFKAGQRVGIFVDYENIARLIPREGEMEQVWQMLASYAAQFGDVVSRWASASPRNLSNLTAVRAGLEAAQFKIRYPRRELQFSASQKDLADYALLECINNASLNDRLDVYLVVSGDRDYYERICSLLESGCTVRVLASTGNLSTSYRELEQQRQRKHKAAGRAESDFFIDDLDEVWRALPPLSH